MHTGKLVLGGLASIGFGMTLYKGVSRKVARDQLRALLTTKPASVTKTRYVDHSTLRLYR
jgi:hypothetical protein